jgi:hypothetical protein
VPAAAENLPVLDGLDYKIWTVIVEGSAVKLTCRHLQSAEVRPAFA